MIENRPGRRRQLAAKAVIAATPDGNTLLVTTAALPINNTLYKNKGFDIADLQAVSIAATTPETLAVNKDSPTKTLKDFIAAKKGAKVNYSSAGVGTGSHIVGEYFFRTIAKIDVAHVPFRSGPDATNAAHGRPRRLRLRVAVGRLRADQLRRDDRHRDRHREAVSGRADGADLRRERLSRASSGRRGRAFSPTPRRRPPSWPGRPPQSPRS